MRSIERAVYGPPKPGLGPGTINGSQVGYCGLGGLSIGDWAEMIQLMTNDNPGAGYEDIHVL